jgi:hypothetical protein
MSQQYSRIILQAGLVEACSNSPHHLFQRHSPLLQAHGIHYPLLPQDGMQLADHSTLLGVALCGKSNRMGLAALAGGDKADKERRGLARNRLEQLLTEASADTLLLSVESLGEFAGADLKAIKKYLSRRCGSLQVTCCVADPSSSYLRTIERGARQGRTVDPSTLPGSMQRRLENLQTVFHDQLLLHHCRVTQDTSAILLAQAGLPQQAIPAVSQDTTGELSEEAWQLASNIAASAAEAPQAGELDTLLTLPGRTLKLPALLNPDAQQQLKDEAAHYQSHPGAQAAPITAPNDAALWQDDCLFALEACIRSLGRREQQLAAADYLVSTAEQLKSANIETAAVLVFIAQRIKAEENSRKLAALQQVGADYFKFGAQLVETQSPELALSLMTIAGELRGDGKRIEKRLANYREILEN